MLILFALVIGSLLIIGIGGIHGIRTWVNKEKKSPQFHSKIFWRILLAGILTPFAARIPGTFLHGIDWLTSYLPSLTGVIFLTIFNIIPFVFLAYLAATPSKNVSRSKIWGTAIIAFGLTFLGHGMLDLSSGSTAGVAIVFIPLWITLFLPIGYFIGWIVGRLMKKQQEASNAR